MLILCISPLKISSCNIASAEKTESSSSFITKNLTYITKGQHNIVLFSAYNRLAFPSSVGIPGLANTVHGLGFKDRCYSAQDHRPLRGCILDISGSPWGFLKDGTPGLTACSCSDALKPIPYTCIPRKRSSSHLPAA